MASTAATNALGQACASRGRCSHGLGAAAKFPCSPRGVDDGLMSRRIAAFVVAAALSGCGDSPAPDNATSEAQVRQRMLEYSLMQITPGSAARLCSYIVNRNRKVHRF